MGVAELKKYCFNHSISSRIQQNKLPTAPIMLLIFEERILGSTMKSH